MCFALEASVQEEAAGREREAALHASKANGCSLGQPG